MQRWILRLWSLLALAGVVACSDTPTQQEPGPEGPLASIPAPVCPSGWTVAHKGIAVVLCQKPYRRTDSERKTVEGVDYLQIANLKAGAQIRPLYEADYLPQSDPTKRWSPLFTKRTAEGWWNHYQDIQRRVCVVSGTFFEGDKTLDSKADLSYPLRDLGYLRTTGSNLTTRGARVLSIRNDEAWIGYSMLDTNKYGAVMKEIDTIEAKSQRGDPNLVYAHPAGWTLRDPPKNEGFEGRTYVGLQDTDNDQYAETIFFYSSPQSNDAHAKTTMGEIGYRNAIELDGGPSTQLYCNGKTLIEGKDFGIRRKIPQAFLVVDALPSPSKSNQLPKASISAPTQGTKFTVGTQVRFSGAGTDPEDGNLPINALVWWSSRDERIGTGREFTTSDLSVGTHTIELTATDSRNATGKSSVAITIEPRPNQRPMATIQAPANGSTVEVGQTVAFKGAASDAEDGTLTGTQLVWRSNLNGQIGTGPSFQRDNLAEGTHTITLEAADSDGLKGVATVTLVVRARASQPPTQPNQPPVPSIFEPDNGRSFAQGAAVQFQGGAIDPEDGALSGSSLVWTSSLNGQIGTGPGFPRSDLSVGAHAITLRATDSKEEARSVTVNISITATPPELPDLTASATVASTYTAGQTGAQVQFTVNRSGGPLTRGTYVTSRLYWSTDSQWNAGDQQLWESNGSTPDFPNAVLNGSGSKTVVPTFNIPQAGAGTYYILAMADADSYHPESNENNNVTPYAVTLRNSEPLVLRIDGSTSSTRPVGQTFNVTGSGLTPGRSVTRYLRQPDGRELTLTPAMSADGSGGISWNYVPVCTTPLGTYTLWVVDDATGRTSNTVTQIVTGSAACDPLALRIDGSTSSTRPIGQTFTVTGSGFTPGRGVTRYLRQPNGSQVTLTPAMSADGSGGISWSFAPVCTTPVGTYTLWVVDDATGRTSNTVTQVVTASAACDPPVLRIDGSMSSTRPIGQTFTVTGSGFTSGRGVTRYLRQPDGSQVTLTPAMSADGSGSITWNYVPVCTTPLGTYTLWVVDDATGRSSNTVTQVVTASTACNTPTLRIDGSTSSTRPVGQTFVTSGSGFTPNRSVTRYLRQPNGSQVTLTPTMSADGNGNLSWSYAPVCTTPLGTHTLWVIDDATGRTSNTVTQVVTAGTSCSTDVAAVGKTRQLPGTSHRPTAKAQQE